ncbi:MAG: proline--tRNA ligase [Kordiimonadaceae bacterium]|nr:proline--tRNA ligase [Kordiimonadaceae bacterium]
MRVSQFLTKTTKDSNKADPSRNAKLLTRAGYIDKLMAGAYSYLPLGLRVLNKIENIVREEMNAIGAHEILMPALQPKDIWDTTGRWDTVDILYKLKGAGDQDLALGPTHEEVVTPLITQYVQSYRDLPKAAYQIQTKFRDEIRPRFGVMRAREFIMKDAYSFCIDREDMAVTYQRMHDAYSQIFTRLGLTFRAVEADSGNIGGATSHEFQVLAQSGEDVIAYSDSSDYAANVEKATALIPQGKRPTPSADMAIVDTPTQCTIDAVSEFLNLPKEKTVKVLLAKGHDDSLVALVLRGDHQLNTIKANQHHLVAEPFAFAEEQEIVQALNCPLGFIGPIGLKELGIPIIVDHDAAQLSDFCCGANQQGKHLTHVNWGRDCPQPDDITDLRNVVAGDASPDGQGQLNITRGIEVGHIFQLGDKYSQTMKATVLNKQGKNIPLQMGCYGIGISRIVAAAIEQSHDARGIIWPKAMAPFDIVLLPMNYHKSHRVRKTCDALYEQLQQAGFDVLFDDRKERPGVLFATADLLGIPHRLLVSEKGIDQGTLEYKARSEQTSQDVNLTEVVLYLKKYW